MGVAARFSDKSQFILQVTHELRSPIAAVLGHHEMILKGLCGDIEPDVRTQLKKANLRARKLLDIVDEMLDYARLSANNESLANSAEVELAELVQEVIDGCPGIEHSIPVEIINHIPPSFTIESNKDLLRIVLSGVVTNAVKYSPSGGEVTLKASRNRLCTCIEVADQGMGIDKAEIGSIFEEFYRSPRARILHDNGSGLGLAIVCQALSCLGGHICVKSRPNQGTLIKVCLPLTSEPFDCPCDAYGAGQASI